LIRLNPRVPRRAEAGRFRQASGRDSRRNPQGAGQLPGLTIEVLTFLGDRIGESLSSETAALAVGVYGADLDTLDKTAAEIAAVLEKVPGAVDVQVQTPPSTPVVRVDLDFQALARYGVSAAEALDAVQSAFQGATAAQIFQDIRSIDIAVTTTPELRRDPEPWAIC
jgi:Cu/Ag efflux pump CusA